MCGMWVYQVGRRLGRISIPSSPRAVHGVRLTGVAVSCNLLAAETLSCTSEGDSGGAEDEPGSGRRIAFFPEGGPDESLTESYGDAIAFFRRSAAPRLLERTDQEVVNHGSGPSLGLGYSHTSLRLRELRRYGGKNMGR